MNNLNYAKLIQNINFRNKSNEIKTKKNKKLKCQKTIQPLLRWQKQGQTCTLWVKWENILSCSAACKCIIGLFLLLVDMGNYVSFMWFRAYLVLFFIVTPLMK